MGGEKMPKGFIQTSGVEEDTDPEFLRQRCVGMPGPSFWALLCRQRMAEYGTTEEQLAKVAVKAHEIAKHNENARFRQEFSLEQVLESAMVSDPLRLYEICPVSDGAAAAVICSAEKARQLGADPMWIAGSAVATARFDDGLPRGLAGIVPDRQGPSQRSGRRRRARPSTRPGAEPTDLDFVELQDNTVYYELRASPRTGGCAGPARPSTCSRRVRRCRPAACRSIRAAASCASARPPPPWACSRCASSPGSFVARPGRARCRGPRSDWPRRWVWVATGPLWSSSVEHAIARATRT